MWWLVAVGGCTAPEALPLPTPAHPPANPPPPIVWSAPAATLSARPGEAMPWAPHTQPVSADDGVRVRSAPGTGSTVVRTLRLGQPVRVLDAVGDPQTIGDRTDRWYRVSVDDDDGTQIGGYVFGATLTSLTLEHDGVPVVATFSPQWQPRVRFRSASGEVHARDLGPPTEGGALSIDAAHGLLQVELCDAGCRRWLVELRDGVRALPPWTDDEPAPQAVGMGPVSGLRVAGETWRASPEGLVPAGCPACTATPLGPSTADVHRVDFPTAFEPAEGDLAPGTDTHLTCTSVGRAGRLPVMSCGWRSDPPAGPATWNAARFLVEAGTWRPLPKASTRLPAPLLEDLSQALAGSGLAIGPPDDRRLVGLGGPEVLLADEIGWLIQVGHHPPGAANGAIEARLLDHPLGGRVVVRPPTRVAARTFDEATSDMRWSGGALVHEPDGSVRVYGWQPWADGPLGPLPGAELTGPWRAAQRGCAGVPIRVNTVVTDLAASQLEPLGTLGGVPVFVPRRSDMPVVERVHAMALQRAASEDPAEHIDTEVPADAGAFLDEHPFLLTRDPWSRWILLLRDDLQLPISCG